MEPIYFTSPAKFRAWLAKHHSAAKEVVVGFYKVGTGKPSMTWSESVDEALCFGWIDGVARGVDDERWCIRFTPRKPSSKWSAVNVKKIQALIADGRMQPAGLAAFERRPDKGAGYSYEEATSTPFDRATERALQREQEGVGVLRGPAARLPAHRHALGDERETRKRRAPSASPPSSTTPPPAAVSALWHGEPIGSVHGIRGDRGAGRGA